MKGRKYHYYDKRERCWYARVPFILQELREAKDAGKQGNKIVAADKMTFNDLADFYQQHFLKPAEYADGKKVAGLRDVQRAESVLVRFREYFNTRLLKEIKYIDVRSYYLMRLKQDTHYKRPPTIATMNRELGVLRRIFSITVREEWMRRNPFGMGEPLISPASERQRERILTIDEERRLLEACHRSEVRALIICLVDTGARLSELLVHLTWKAVCFTSRTITIHAMTTKTLTARQVTMTERTYRELTAMWEASAKIEEDRVFDKTVRIVRRDFRLACEAAKIPYGSPEGITLHSLRHTAATRLVRGQMPIHLVGRILGHSQPHTTYRYISADAEATRQASAILEAVQLQPSEVPVQSAEIAH
jgi:integrase